MTAPDLFKKGYCAVEMLAMSVMTIMSMTEELARKYQCDKNGVWAEVSSPKRHDGDIWLAVLQIPATCLNRIWVCTCHRSWVEIEVRVVGALEKGVEIEILQHIVAYKVGIIDFIYGLLLKSASNAWTIPESSK